jgi:hypothetical protein
MATTSTFCIEGNGTRNIGQFFGGYPRKYFTAKWGTPDIPRAGTLAFSFDGNPGDPPAVMDMSTNDNAFAWTVRVSSCIVEVSDLPDGAKIILEVN